MAQVDSRRLRSGSLSSGSDSESGSGSIDEDSRSGRMKSAIVQVPPSHLKPTLSPPPRPSLSSVDDIHSSPPPHKRRRNVITPSPPSHRHRDRPSPSSRDQRRNPRSPPLGKRRGASPSRGRKDEHTPPYKRRRPRRTPSPQSSSESEDHTPSPKRKREEPDPLTTRTGGAYIPPARLRMMQAGIADKSSVAYQRVSWEALKKSINGLINKVNASNIDKIVPELFEENVVRGRGLMSRSVIQAQAASPMFSHVYAALVAVVNTKFPQTGELICKRLILQFRKGFKRNDKNICMAAVKFLAHLVNQQVLHELVALELLTLLMEEPTDDTVEVAVGFIKECGLKLTDVSPRGIHAMFETLRSILHSGKISPRIQYMIEVLFAIRKDKFKDHPVVVDGLDLVEEDDQITHLLSLTDEIDGEEALNVFHPDPDFVANEEKYKVIKAEILGDGSGSEESGSESSEGEESSEAEDEEGETKMEISDMTDANVLALRRTIYLTIMSSANYEECVHKLLRSKQEGSESEIASMVIECCSQERSYLRFYGLLSQRLCLLNQAWVAVFDEAFQQQYATVHRLETNKLRNTARLFAQLFYSDAIPWTALSCVHLNEEETNSSSRIFVKIMFQELSEFMGMARLNERLRDPLLAVSFEGLLPRDNPKNTRFAINFFTSIGLGGLTDDLREHLKNAQKMIMEQKQDVSSSDTDSSSSEEDDSTSEESSSEDSSEASSSSEEEEDKRRSQRRHKGHSSSSHKHRSKSGRSPSVSNPEDERRRRKRKSDSPEKLQRRKRGDSPDRSQRKKRGDSPDRSQRKKRSDSPDQSQRKKRGDSPDRTQRKNRGDSPDRTQRKNRGDSPDRSQRKNRGDSPDRSQRKKRGDSPDRSQRKRERGTPELPERNKREGSPKQIEVRNKDRGVERKGFEGRGHPQSKRREASGSPERAQRDSSGERELPPRREEQSQGQREKRERHRDRDASRKDSERRGDSGSRRHRDDRHKK